MIVLVFILSACGIEVSTSTDEGIDDVEANIEVEDEIETASSESATEENAKEKEVNGEQNPNKEEKDSTKLEELQVHYIDVGQADATLLQYSDGEENYNILFDAGDWRGNEVVSYLTANDVSIIDLVIISHPDADHIGQLEKVMNAFDVGEVWMSGNESSSQTFERAIEAVLESDADYHEPRAGEGFDIGPLALDVLYPDNISGKANEESISVLFTYGSVKFLFTGDADRAGESYMRNQFDVNADVLHLGHHGSKTSSDPGFVDAVSPRIAIYSAGAGNSYGHPSPEVVSIIQDRNIELYGTDGNGTIIITTDGKTIQDTETDVTVKSIPVTEPASTEEEPPAEEETSDVTSSGCVNINEASVEKVQEIIHIGPERAQDLIDLRPYAKVDNLDKLSGIGPARIADIKSEGKACVQ